MTKVELKDFRKVRKEYFAFYQKERIAEKAAAKADFGKEHTEERIALLGYDRKKGGWEIVELVRGTMKEARRTAKTWIWGGQPVKVARVTLKWSVGARVK